MQDKTKGEFLQRLRSSTARSNSPSGLSSWAQNLGGTRPLQHFRQGDANDFVPSNFCMTQSQSSAIKFSSYFFYRLKSVVTNLGARFPKKIFVGGGH